MIWDFRGYRGIVAIRDGDWKAVRRNLNAKKPGDWELYNLTKDVLIVNLLNKGSSKSVQLAELNLQASMRAHGMSALASAAKFAAFGIDNLGADPWEKSRRLALQLYSVGAEAESCTGNNGEVLQGGTRTTKLLNF